MKTITFFRKKLSALLLLFFIFSCQQNEITHSYELKNAGNEKAGPSSLAAETRKNSNPSILLGNLKKRKHYKYPNKTDDTLWNIIYAFFEIDSPTFSIKNNKLIIGENGSYDAIIGSIDSAISKATGFHFKNDQSIKFITYNPPALERFAIIPPIGDFELFTKPKGNIAVFESIKAESLKHINDLIVEFCFIKKEKVDEWIGEFNTSTIEKIKLLDYLFEFYAKLFDFNGETDEDPLPFSHNSTFEKRKASLSTMACSLNDGNNKEIKNTISEISNLFNELITSLKELKPSDLENQKASLDSKLSKINQLKKLVKDYCDLENQKALPEENLKPIDLSNWDDLDYKYKGGSRVDLNEGISMLKELISKHNDSIINGRILPFFDYLVGEGGTFKNSSPTFWVKGDVICKKGNDPYTSKIDNMTITKARSFLGFESLNSLKENLERILASSNNSASPTNLANLLRAEKSKKISQQSLQRVLSKIKHMYDITNLLQLLLVQRSYSIAKAIDPYNSNIDSNYFPIQIDSAKTRESICLAYICHNEKINNAETDKIPELEDTIREFYGLIEEILQINPDQGSNDISNNDISNIEKRINALNKKRKDQKDLFKLDDKFRNHLRALIYEDYKNKAISFFKEKVGKANLAKENNTQIETWFKKKFLPTVKTSIEAMKKDQMDRMAGFGGYPVLSFQSFPSKINYDYIQFFGLYSSSNPVNYIRLYTSSNPDNNFQSNSEPLNKIIDAYIKDHFSSDTTASSKKEPFFADDENAPLIPKAGLSNPE